MSTDGGESSSSRGPAAATNGTPVHACIYRYGIDVTFLDALMDHWRHGFDWRAAERGLNAHAQFETVIDGLRVHFIHARGAAGAGVRIVPLLLVHGWPGSVAEFSTGGFVASLTAPRDGIGSTGRIAFDVVAPSIPGYGWSEAPVVRRRAARQAQVLLLLLQLHPGGARIRVWGPNDNHIAV